MRAIKRVLRPRHHTVTVNAPCPKKEGWLMKQGGLVKNWNLRWFVLEDYKLTYYAKSDSEDKRGEIPFKLVKKFFAEVDDIKKHIKNAPRDGAHIFCVKLHDGRYYFFQADTAEVKEEWVDILGRAWEKYVAVEEAQLAEKEKEKAAEKEKLQAEKKDEKAEKKEEQGEKEKEPEKAVRRTTMSKERAKTVLQAWTGTYSKGSETFKIYCQLSFPEGKAVGSGKDNLGEFTWSGSHQDAEVTLKKEYKGDTPVVHYYRCTLSENEDSLQGKWYLEEGEEATPEGDFQLTRGDGVAVVAAGVRVSTAPVPEAEDKNAGQAEWNGWYEEDDKKTEMNATLKFEKGKVTGSGSDSVGEFTFEGTYENGNVCLMKHYTGHTILYEGELLDDGNELSGTWYLPNDNLDDDEAAGDFELRKKKD